MTNPKMIVYLILIGLFAAGLIAWFTSQDNALGYVLLFAAWSIGCVVLGWSLYEYGYSQFREDEQC